MHSNEILITRQPALWTSCFIKSLTHYCELYDATIWASTIIVVNVNWCWYAFLIMIYHPLVSSSYSADVSDQYHAGIMLVAYYSTAII